MNIKERFKLEHDYSCDSSLGRWFNRLIEKEIKDINIEDVCRMLRQDFLVEVATPVGIQYLYDDPFCGELYEGELLKCFIRDQKSQIYDNETEFIKIAKIAENKLKSDNQLIVSFEENGSKQEIEELIKRLNNILSGKEPNLHLDLISKTIRKHFVVESISTNILNPEYSWQKIPNLTVRFGELSSDSSAKSLDKLLSSFNGNCSWIIKPSRFFQKNKGTYYITVKERKNLSAYKRKHKREVWEAALDDIVALSNHIDDGMPNT